MAIGGGLVLAVGPTADLKAMARSQTRVIDCAERTLIPGLHDAHLHLFAYASRLASVECSPPAVRSIAALQAALRAQAATQPPGTWIRAVGYDETALEEGRHPNRDDLDVAAPHHPVRLYHRSYHACVTNSLGLRAAGVTVATAEPVGGLIDRDLGTGEPTGLFFETAQGLVNRVVPSLTYEELEHGVGDFSRQLASWGVTALQDATPSTTVEDWGTFHRLQTSGALLQRTVMMFGAAQLPNVLAAGWTPHREQGLLRLGAAKIVLDESTGRVQPDARTLADLIAHAHDAGFQVALHAVTSTALDAALAALETVITDSPRLHPRHRIEHCSVCTPPQAARIARLRVHVATQPGFVHYSGARYLSEVAEEELPWLYPCETLLNAGVALAGSSDSPIAPANPWAGIYGAVTRLSEHGRLLSPEQRVSVNDALNLYTHGSAAASFQEHRLGRIAPGYKADLALLSDDPLASAPVALLSMASVLTIVAGKIVYMT